MGADNDDVVENHRTTFDLGAVGVALTPDLPQVGPADGVQFANVVAEHDVAFLAEYRIRANPTVTW